MFPATNHCGALQNVYGVNSFSSSLTFDKLKKEKGFIDFYTAA